MYVFANITTRDYHLRLGSTVSVNQSSLKRFKDQLPSRRHVLTEHVVLWALRNGVHDLTASTRRVQFLPTSSGGAAGHPSLNCPTDFQTALHVLALPNITVIDAKPTMSQRVGFVMQTRPHHPLST
jgi:hypothetical protein